MDAFLGVDCLGQSRLTHLKDQECSKPSLSFDDSLIVENAEIVNAGMDVRQKLAPALGVNRCDLPRYRFRDFLLIFLRVLKAHVGKRVRLTPSELTDNKERANDARHETCA
jgi:hypothetical protein